MNKLKVEIYIGGKKVDTLTEEQRDRVAARFSAAVSDYYTRHIDEYQAFLGRKTKKDLAHG